ncbi:MAG: hypothetical protein AAF998_27965 [Bacteroidota bacterium]
MKKLILVVEGDCDLRTLTQVVPAGVSVTRRAGKYGMRAFIQGYRQAKGEALKTRRANRIGTTRTHNRNQVWTLLQNYLAEAQSIVDKTQFEDLYRRYCSMFDDQFIATRKYLTWFQAKDQQKQMTGKLAPFTANFPWKSDYKTVIDQFEYSQYPDLVELRAALRQRTA